MSEELTKAQKLTAQVEKAFADRQLANKLFVSGDLQGALRGYHYVLLEVKGIASNPTKLGPDATVEEIAEVDRTTNQSNKIKKEISLTYLNMAAISIKLDKFQKALDYATSSLALDEDNVKAAFRKGQALIGLGQITAGQQVLTELQKKVVESTGKPDGAIATTLYELKKSEKAGFGTGAGASGFKGMFGKEKEGGVKEITNRFEEVVDVKEG